MKLKNAELEEHSDNASYMNNSTMKESAAEVVVSNHGRQKRDPPTPIAGTKSMSSRRATAPYYIENGNLMREPEKDQKDAKPRKIGQRIEILENCMNVDTNIVEVTLGYDYNDQSCTIKTQRGNLGRKGLLDLAKYGLDVGEHNVPDVAKWLNKQEKLLPVTRTHSHLGFGLVGGKLIFKHAVAIGSNSKYEGKALILPQGTLDAWMAVMTKEVLGRPALELALVIGLAGPVASMIAKETQLEVIVVHIYGDSSTGKTTAARVAVSSFGYPGTQDGGLIKTWNSTDNALIGQLRNNFGIPIAIDEASMRDSISSKLIYTLASGRDKSRLQKTGEQQEPAQWEGVIISTAEHGLQEKSSKNVGIAVRLQEIGNVQWTVSANNADALKETLTKNYGHAGPILVKHLLEIESEAVMKMWREERVHIMEKMSNPDHFANRLADRVAVFAVTAKLAKASLGLDLNWDSMLEILLTSIDDASDTRDIGRSSYDYFLEAVNRHSAKFASQNLPERSNELWGKLIRKGENVKEIYILPDKFRELMAEGGYDSSDVILRNWKQRNLLDCDPGKNTRKKALNGFNPRVHVVLIEQDRCQNESVVQTRERKMLSRTMGRVSNTVIQNLFNED